MNVNWERLWRMNGINFVVFFIIAYVIYGNQPKVGASTDKLVSFYDGDRTRILIATVIFGLAVLNLLWFAAAITSTLRDAGQGGWGAAATAASAALGAVFFVLITVGAALAYSIAGSGNDQLTSGLNDLSWVCIVIASFPAAMLIMAGSFGLWRGNHLERALFGRGRSGRACPAWRNHVGERRDLGAGRCLFAVHLADRRPCVGRGHQRATRHASPLSGGRG